MRSAEYRCGYDAGYKQALMDALRERDFHTRKIGGPDAPKPPMGEPYYSITNPPHDPQFSR